MSRDNLIWGFVLIVVGSLFLADNLGYIEFDFSLLWPLLLIFIGINILLGRRSAQGHSDDGEQVSVPLEGAEEGRIQIEHGAGRIRISGRAAQDQLLSGRFHHLDLTSKRSGSALAVKLSTTLAGGTHFIFPWNWGGAQHEWDFSLNPSVPISLDIDTGASDAHLDLSQLNVKELKLDTGASSTKLIVPEKAGFSRVDISSGAASHDIIIPQGVAADIRVESGLSGISVDEKRFPRSGSHYTSPDYGSAANKVELNIETGVSSVTVK